MQYRAARIAGANRQFQLLVYACMQGMMGSKVSHIHIGDYAEKIKMVAV